MTTLMLCNLLFALLPFSGQDSVQVYRQYIRQADSLFMQGAFPQASEAFAKAFEMDGCIQGSDLYNGACAAARAGNADAAFERLSARMALEPDWYSDGFARDEDLTGLHPDARWQAFADSMSVRRERAERFYDRPLRQQLRRIAEADQTIRQQFIQAYYAQPKDQRLVDSLTHEMQRTDSLNQIAVCDILDRRGFVGSQTVGDACQVFWLVIQHAPVELQRKYLPAFRKAVETGDMAPSQVAMMEDRIAMFEGRPQKYGSQLVEDRWGRMVVYDLLDPDMTDQWRKEQGMEPLSEYLQQMGARMPVAAHNATQASQQGLTPWELLQQGDSCMRDYNTHKALAYYRQAFEQADCAETRMKLADCHYRRAGYRRAAELLKNVPEDSLSHDAFRQLALSYKKLGDLDAFVYWAGRLVDRYPMDGEMVAGLTVGCAQLQQPQNGINYGLDYFVVDSTNAEVIRALADAFFIDRRFDKAASMYDRLIAQGDSTFNTLYSAGMAYARIDSLERAYDCLSRALVLSQLQHQGCAYRLGVVCVDTQRIEEGLGYLNLATELARPDTTMMRAVTLSQGEGYYLTQRYPEAVEAWKQHLSYNPGSIATYYNIANAYQYLLKDAGQARAYYLRFLDLARKEENPTPQLVEMMGKAEEAIREK